MQTDKPREYEERIEESWGSDGAAIVNHYNDAYDYANTNTYDELGRKACEASDARAFMKLYDALLIAIPTAIVPFAIASLFSKSVAERQAFAPYLAALTIVIIVLLAQTVRTAIVRAVFRKTARVSDTLEGYLLAFTIARNKEAVAQRTLTAGTVSRKEREPGSNVIRAFTPDGKRVVRKRFTRKRLTTRPPQDPNQPD